MSSCCYLNGEIVPLEQARISPLDRGFLFGDGVYEFFPIYARRLFRFEYHMQRLERSLGAIGLRSPHDRDAWLKIASQLAATREEPDLSWYLQITRGADQKRDHAFPGAQVTPTVFGMINPLPRLSPQQRSEGLRVVSAVDQRWHRCDIKSISLLGNVLARQYSAEVDAHETILFRDGYLTEASSSNVWIVRHGRLIGPVLDQFKLEGVRWGLLEQLCARIGVAFNTRPIPQWEVLQADELLLTSATKEVAPVTQVDGRLIGDGKPGPIYARLYEAYQQVKPEQSTALP